MGYILIAWPESQNLMEIDGYEEHCSLADPEIAGPCAYLVEADWWNNIINQ